jgi:hypothetical protein
MGRPTRYSVAGVGIPRGGMAWVRLSAADSRGATSVWLPTEGPDGHVIAPGDEVDIWAGPDGSAERAEVDGALYWSCDPSQAVCPCCRSTYIEDATASPRAAPTTALGVAAALPKRRRRT